jgi:hypothetical protein
MLEDEQFKKDITLAIDFGSSNVTVCYGTPQARHFLKSDDGQEQFIPSQSMLMLDSDLKRNEFKNVKWLFGTDDMAKLNVVKETDVYCFISKIKYLFTHRQFHRNTEKEVSQRNILYKRIVFGSNGEVPKIKLKNLKWDIEHVYTAFLWFLNSRIDIAIGTDNIYKTILIQNPGYSYIDQERQLACYREVFKSKDIKINMLPEALCSGWGICSELVDRKVVQSCQKYIVLVIDRGDYSSDICIIDLKSGQTLETESGYFGGNELTDEILYNSVCLVDGNKPNGNLPQRWYIPFHIRCNKI